MSTVILCSGNYAKTPYYIAEEDLHLYSVEELCYYLYKNAFMLQEDFFGDALLSWISQELGLSQWADALKEHRGKEDVLFHSIEYLFLMTGYFGREECEKVHRILQDGSRLSVQERKKLRADAYCKRQRYVMAIAEYEEILKTCSKEDVKLRARLYHNMGVCLAGMFVFDRAADCFKKAFHAYPNTESYVQLLAALKLGCSQTEYLSYLAEHPESYEDSLEVEARLKRMEQDWDNLAMPDVVDRLVEEEQVTHYEAVSRLLRQAKEEYTNMVSKG